VENSVASPPLLGGAGGGWRGQGWVASPSVATNGGRPVCHWAVCEVQPPTPPLLRGTAERREVVYEVQPPGPLPPYLPSPPLLRRGRGGWRGWGWVGGLGGCLIRGTAERSELSHAATLLHKPYTELRNEPLAVFASFSGLRSKSLKITKISVKKEKFDQKE
jgi:hypothetical protein